MNELFIDNIDILTDYCDSNSQSCPLPFIFSNSTHQHYKRYKRSVSGIWNDPCYYSWGSVSGNYLVLTGPTYSLRYDE